MVDELIINSYVKENLPADDYKLFCKGGLSEEILDYIDSISCTRVLPRKDFLSAVNFTCIYNGLILLG